MIGAAVGIVSLIGTAIGVSRYAETNYAKQSDMMIVELQVQDALDARIQAITKQISELEAKAKAGKASSYDMDHLKELKSEYERLRQLRYGKYRG